jgi:hypothetical protein
MDKQDEEGYCYTRLADPNMTLGALDGLDVMARNVSSIVLLEWAKAHDLLLNHTKLRAMVYPSKDPDNPNGLAAHLQDALDTEEDTLTF